MTAYLQQMAVRLCRLGSLPRRSAIFWLWLLWACDKAPPPPEATDPEESIEDLRAEQHSILNACTYKDLPPEDRQRARLLEQRIHPQADPVPAADPGPSDPSSLPPFLSDDEDTLVRARDRILDACLDLDLSPEQRLLAGLLGQKLRLVRAAHEPDEALRATMIWNASTFGFGGEAFAFEVLPDFLFDASWITDLHISRMPVREIPPAIARLHRLRRFDPHLSELASLPPELGRLAQLEELVVTDTKIRELPAEIGQLTALKKLLLFDNQLRELPAEIGHLKNLERLDLDGNQLTELPAELGRLVSLRSLSLGDQRHKRFPPTLEQLTELRALWLKDAHLLELPEFVTKLEHLERLYLQSNRLTELPETIGRLKNLRVLDVQSNRLTKLPEALGELHQLRELNLQGNRLSALPDSIAGLPALDLLIVDDNRLKALPHSLSKARKLWLLSAKGNHITKVPPGLCPSGGIDVSANPVQDGAAKVPCTTSASRLLSDRRNRELQRMLEESEHERDTDPDRE